MATWVTRALVLGVFACPCSAWAQSSSATLTGIVVDSTGAALSAAKIAVVNLGTAAQRDTISGKDGAFTITTLPPGQYVLHASLTGFTPAELRDIVLNVNDRVSVRVEMAVASVTEGVTVTAETRRISTSPAVSTVIDRQFVENLPLNGRSFQTLLSLTPGVVLTSVGHASQEGGQFSVNGQRPSANYWTVDGVSANAGISSGVYTNPGQSGSGQLPAMTALGGTNGLVSVDALQEFRIQTSTYAPEFGRMPGGQISLVTRAGTNLLHGTMFEYFRDDSLDATDWFTNYAGQDKAQMRQHNFGGVLGGPVLRNRTFFFASYEGLRLEQPRAKIVPVPTMELRRAANPALQPFLNAVPIPNGLPLSTGLQQFIASYSDPSRFDATSVRVDHSLQSGRHILFARVNYAPSYSSTRSLSLSTVDSSHQDATSITVGSTWVLSPRLVHDVRVNYSADDAPLFSQPDDFGGAVPATRALFQQPGAGPEDGLFVFGSTSSSIAPWRYGLANALEQRQINLVDSLTMTTASHDFKVGLDIRRSSPLLGFNRIEILNVGVTNATLGRVDLYSTTYRVGERPRVAFDNLSLYAQDHWRLGPRLTLTYGLRWEIVPAPHSISGNDALTLESLDTPYSGQVRFAPSGTRLFSTRYDDIAPRIGASYVLSERAGGQLVVRGGVGLFHDTAFGQIANMWTSNYPFQVQKNVSGPDFPLLSSTLRLPTPGATPPSLLYVMDRDIELPQTYQWNVSMEKAFGPHQSVTVGLVGADGRRLLRPGAYSFNMMEWPTPAPKTTVYVTGNGGYSDYRAVQVQFQRRLHRGLQSIVSYTWGRSRDTNSSDFVLSSTAEQLPPETDYGYSAHDVRHVFTGAVTYQVSWLSSSSWLRTIARDWGIDLMVRARSGFPITVFSTVVFPPETLAVRPNLVPGQPVWVEDPNVPSALRLNRQAFTVPPTGVQGDLVRGSVRGFSAKQVDLALRRDFGLVSHLRMQLRFEMFNLFNTPNFADPNGNLGSATFGQSTQSLNRSMGGLSPLYQIGGARSSQIAAKLTF